MKFFSNYLNSIDNLNRLESRKHYVFKPFYDFNDPYATITTAPEYEIELNIAYSNAYTNTITNTPNIDTVLSMDTFRFSMDDVSKAKEYQDYVIVDLTFVEAKIITYPLLEKVSLSNALIDSELDIDILHYNSDPTPYDMTLRESFRKGSSYRKIKIPYQKTTNEASKYIVIDDNYYAPKVDNVLIHDLKSLGMELVLGTTTDILDKHKPNTIGYMIPKKNEPKLVSTLNYVFVDDVLVPLKVKIDIGTVTVNTQFLEENVIDFVTKEVSVKDLRDSYTFNTFNLNDTLKVNKLPNYKLKQTEVKNFVITLSSGVKVISNLSDDTIELSSDLSTIGVYDDLQLTNQLTSIDRFYPTVLTNGIDYTKKAQTSGLLVIKNDGTYVLSDSFNGVELSSELNVSFASFDTTNDSKRWNELHHRVITPLTYSPVEADKSVLSYTYVNKIDDTVYSTKLYSDVEYLIYNYRLHNSSTNSFYLRPDIFVEFGIVDTDVRTHNVNTVYTPRFKFDDNFNGVIDLSNRHLSSLKYLNKPIDKVGNLFRTEKYGRKLVGEYDDIEISGNVYEPYYVADKIDVILSTGAYNTLIELNEHKVVNRVYDSSFVIGDVQYRLINTLENDYEIKNGVYTGTDIFGEVGHSETNLVNHPVESKVYIPTDVFSEVIPADVNERNFIKVDPIYSKTDIFSEVIPAEINERTGIKERVYLPLDTLIEAIPADVYMTNQIKLEKVYEVFTGYDYVASTNIVTHTPEIPALVSKVYTNEPKFGYKDIIERLIIERDFVNLKNNISKIYYKDIFEGISTSIFEIRDHLGFSYNKPIFRDVRPSEIALTYNQLKGSVFESKSSNKAPTSVNLNSYVESGVIYLSQSSIPLINTSLFEVRDNNSTRIYSSNGFGDSRPIETSFKFNNTPVIYNRTTDDRIGITIGISLTRDENVPSSYLNGIELGSIISISNKLEEKDKVYYNTTSEKQGIRLDSRLPIEDRIYETPLRDNTLVGLSDRTTGISSFYSKEILSGVNAPHLDVSVAKPTYEKADRLKYLAESTSDHIIDGFKGRLYADYYTVRFKEITGFTDRSPEAIVFNYKRDYFVGLDTYKWDTVTKVDTIFGKTLRIPFSGVGKEPSLYSQSIYKFIEPRYAKLERPQGVTSYKQPILGLVYNGYLERQKFTELTLDLDTPVTGRVYNTFIPNALTSDRTINISSFSKGILYEASSRLSSESLVYKDTKDTTIYLNIKPIERALNYDVQLDKKLFATPSYEGAKLGYDVKLDSISGVVPSFDREETIKYFDATRTNAVFSATKPSFREVEHLRFNDIDLGQHRYIKTLDEYVRHFEGTRSTIEIPHSNYFVREKALNIVLSAKEFRYNNGYSQNLLKSLIDVKSDVYFRYDNYGKLSTFDRAFEGTRASLLYKNDNYDLSTYARQIDISDVIYKTDVLYKNIGASSFDLGKESFRYDNYDRLSSYKELTYELAVDLRTINSNLRPNKFVDTTPNITHTSDSKLYDRTYVLGDTSFNFSYAHKGILSYDKRDERDNLEYDLAYRTESLYDMDSYRDMESFNSHILYTGVTTLFDKKSSDEIVPNIGRLTIPVELTKTTYPSIPLVISGTIEVDYRRETSLYTKPFEGVSLNYSSLYTGAEKIFDSRYVSDITSNSLDYRIITDRIYAKDIILSSESVSYSGKHLLSDRIYSNGIIYGTTELYDDYKQLINKLYGNRYVANVDGLNHLYNEKVSVEKVYDNSYVANVDGLNHLYNEKVSVEKVYENTYVANVDGLVHNYSEKVAINKLYNNLYVANVLGLVHNYSFTDNDSELVNKKDVYNKYNYQFSALTDLYSKPSVALYDKPFLKYIPRYVKEAVQSYNVFETDIDLRTIESYNFVKPVVEYSIDVSVGKFRYEKPIGISTSDIRTRDELNKPFRYRNDLGKYNNNYPSIVMDSPVLYSKNYLTFTSSFVDKAVDLSTFRYENVISYKPSFDISIGKGQENYLAVSKHSDITATPSYEELKYDNNLAKYATGYDISLNTVKDRNYLAKTVEYKQERAGVIVRYNNDLSKYSNTYDLVINTTTDRNYLSAIKENIAPESDKVLRYSNDLSKYANSYDIVIDTDVRHNYLSKVENKVIDSDLSVFRYNNTLDGYTVSFNSQVVGVFRPEKVYSTLELVTVSDLSTFRYAKDLSSYKWSINQTSVKVADRNYLVGLTTPTNEKVNELTLRYNNGLDKYSRGYDVVVDDRIEKPLYDSISDIYKSFKHSDLSSFRYNNTVSKYVEDEKPKSIEVPSFRYENNNMASFKRSIDLLDCQSVQRAVSYSRVTQNLSFDYQTTNAPDLKQAGAFNKIKGITNINYGMMSNKPDANNLYAKKEILQGLTKLSYKYGSNAVKGSLYSQTEKVMDRVPTYNRTIQTIADAKVYKPRVAKEELTPLYKGTLKYTDIETRFTLRGPVNYDMYGEDVKVVMMEQNKQGFAWEQHMDSVAYKSKNLLQQESAFTYKKDPVVVTGSPVLTRENQIEYYFGGKGKLKMEKISGTYTNPDGEYPLAAPVNCTVKGIMRPTTSVAIQHIIEYDYEKIDEVDVAPVFNETGDRVSLFSDRFFLQ